MNAKKPKNLLSIWDNRPIYGISGKIITIMNRIPRDSAMYDLRLTSFALAINKGFIQVLMSELANVFY